MSCLQPVKCVCKVRILDLIDTTGWLFASRKTRQRMLQPVCLGKTYVCRGCKRRVPACFGASDDMPNHCDDCWAAAHREAA